ncbi:TniQ family protein [Cocleimonas sp. KMM 6892]|uniref:TniQ family protein n=1 Tax=unclassified Cocleimonas TaxID=2639732 RepID=UPI002DBA252C|nr:MULTISPECIES: TniQ family protein [unclassified Cocleimonas]MEB8432594.1 TniQ family protein [Cocleimonas sp. KMM 6892]MEC4715453.1 TniQ family protein [Cocleimonas sp. KMM 6895]MEC4744928.1 TniQ family protein [Cocleimonas sp. KMM 6896]
MDRRLLHLPIPYDDESPGSLLLRTTEYNGWKSSSALLTTLKYQYSNRSALNLESIFCDKEKWINLWKLYNKQNNAYLCNCYWRSGISKRSNVAFMKVVIPWKMLRLKAPAICPKCISESHYQKRIWDFKLITTCSKHSVKLINSCPSCKKVIGWNRKKISFCDCSYNLEDSPTETIDNEGTACIEHFLENKDCSNISLLCQYAEIYKEFLKLLDEPIDDHLIATMSAFSAENNKYMQETLYFYIKKYIKSHALHPRVTLGPFLLSKNKIILSNVNKILESLKRHEVPTKSSTPRGSIHITMASAILGATDHATKTIFHKDRYSEKIDGKILPSRITLETINNFLNKLTLGGEKETSDLLTSFPRGFNEKIYDVIPKFLSGETKYSVDQLTSRGIMGISLIRRPVKERLEENSTYFSILETAQICNVHYENIRFAIKCGVLNRVDCRKTKGTQIFIEKKEAYEFNQLYVFSGALALKHVCNSRTLAEKLIASGIRPVSGPKIDGGLTYLFRREEINRINLKKVDALRKYPTNTGRKSKTNSSNVDYSISLASAANMLDISTQKASQLIQKGCLIEYEDKYRRKSVTYESFHRIFDILSNPNSKTLFAAAQALNQTEREFTLRYISTKLVKSIQTGRGLYLSEKEFNKAKSFNELCITSKEAGKLLEVNSSYLNNLKRTNKIKPVKKLSLGSRKISFYSRSEIVALKKRLTR